MTRFTRLMTRLRAHALRTCLVADGRAFTYERLLQEYDEWRARLEAHAVGRNSVVGLRADYSLAAIAALLALWERRAIAALIPRSRDCATFVHDAHAMAMLEFNADGTYQWICAPPPEDHPLLEQLRDADDAGVVLFTSGSTGRPKAALQSIERFLSKFDKPGRRFRTLAFLLFDHVGGLDTLFYTLSNGGTVVVTRRRDPHSILPLIESEAVEVLPTSPSFLRLLCKAIHHDRHDLTSLKIITYGSEPMDAPTLSRLNQLFPNATLSQKYGTTETGSPRTVSRGNDSLWLKIGRDGVDTKVVDDLLWIRSQGAMLGYLNASAPTDAQGWYCTGDLVDVDGEWIRFRGRATDTINVGGEKVSPAEVEQCIMQLTFVTDALVSGKPHPLLGQIVMAQIVLSEDAPDPNEAIRHIRSHCRRVLPRFKVPMSIDIAPSGFASDRQKVKRTSFPT